MSLDKRWTAPMVPRTRKHHVGWLIVLILTVVSLSIPLISARVALHAANTQLQQLRDTRWQLLAAAHAQRQRMNTLCTITDGQSRILAMNLPGTVFDWSPPIGELCR
jgi:hypothetical protein